MPLFGLGVLILWLGGSASTRARPSARWTAASRRSRWSRCWRRPPACSPRWSPRYWKTKAIDIGMAGNGAIAALVAITAPVGLRGALGRRAIGAIAGVIVPLGVYAIDKKIDDPVGALSAHGLRRHLGHARPAASSPRRGWPQYNGSARRPALHGPLAPARHSGAGRRCRSSRSCSRSRSSRSGRSRRPTACASRPRRRKPVWTSPSTACTATRSSTRRRSQNRHGAGMNCSG